MSIFYNFIDRAVLYSCKGKVSELIVPTRKGKTREFFAMNTEKSLMLKDDTLFVNGDLLVNTVDGSKGFLVGLQKSTAGAVQGQLKIVNATADIVKIIAKFNGSKNIGNSEELLLSSLSVFVTDVSGTAKLYDAGLLDTTIKKVITVANTDIKLAQRIKIDGSNYQINNINTTKYPRLYELQVAVDTR